MLATNVDRTWEEGTYDTAIVAANATTAVGTWHGLWRWRSESAESEDEEGGEVEDGLHFGFWVGEIGRWIGGFFFGMWVVESFGVRLSWELLT